MHQAAGHVQPDKSPLGLLTSGKPMTAGPPSAPRVSIATPSRYVPTESPPLRAPVPLLAFASRVGLILVALHAYIGWRLLPAWPIGLPGEVAGGLLLLLSTLLIQAGMLARFFIAAQPLADRLAWAGALAMGLFSSLLVLTFLRDILLLLPGSAPLRTATAIAVPVLALAFSLVGLVNARRLPRVVEVDIHLQDWPAALAGFTIVQLSDIHVGATIKGDYLRAVVARANTLAADLVAITGDVVDGSVAQLAEQVAPLAELRAGHGVFLVTGNHEYYSGALPWIAEFRRLGLQVLLNQHVIIEQAGAAFVLAGVTDFSAGHFDPAQQSDPARALAGAPAGRPAILLAHQPRSAKAAAAAGFALQLSGHTHGGQFWPWIHFVRLQQPWTAGLHRLAGLQVYTSRGTGYWGPPKRFGAPAEITRLRLWPPGEARR